MEVLFVGIFGLVVGSFIAAYSWRITHNISISKGRSFCDSCKNPIGWYDNIPVVSYLFLGGKCRHCHKRISPRYPLIESLTAISFVLLYFSYSAVTLQMSFLLSLGIGGLIFMFFVLATLIAISVVDLEEMIIPDTYVFTLFFVSFFVVLFSNSDKVWIQLLSGFASALFFLLLHLFTKGRGMGLGDVKLAIPLGFLLGYPLSIVWIFSSFLIGSVIGIVLILFKKAHKQSKIPFGPFLILGFCVAAVWGNNLIQYFAPYL